MVSGEMAVRGNNGNQITNFMTEHPLARRAGIALSASLLALTAACSEKSVDSNTGAVALPSAEPAASAPPSAAPSPKPVVTGNPMGPDWRTGPGKTGPGVSYDQDLLTKAGCYIGKIDGEVADRDNALTARTIRLAQGILGKSQDGWLGPDTRPVIEQKVAAGEKVCPTPEPIYIVGSTSGGGAANNAAAPRKEAPGCGNVAGPAMPGAECNDGTPAGGNQPPREESGSKPGCGNVAGPAMPGTRCSDGSNPTN